MIKTTVPLTVAMRDRTFAKALTRGLAFGWRELKVRCDDAFDGEKEGAALSCCGERPEAVLTDEESFEEVCERYPDVPLFVIGEAVPTNRRDVSFLHPFSGAREIGASVLEGLGRASRPRAEGDSFRILVTSAAGGCGVSSVATALARVIRRMTRRPCLYLSYEPYPGGWRYFGGPDNGRTLGDFLFRLSGPFGNAIPESYLREDPDGVSYFAGDGAYNELPGLAAEDADAFFGALAGTVNGGTVVFDAPYPDLRAIEPVLASAHTLVLVGDGSEETEARNGVLERLISERFDFRRVIRVVNESRSGRPIRAVIREGDFVLPYDPDSMEPGRISLEKGFGSGVREIAEELERVRRGEGPAGESGNGRGGAYRGDRPAEDAGGRRAAFR